MELPDFDVPKVENPEWDQSYAELMQWYVATSSKHGSEIPMNLMLNCMVELAPYCGVPSVLLAFARASIQLTKQDPEADNRH